MYQIFDFEYVTYTCTQFAKDHKPKISEGLSEFITVDVTLEI